MCLTCSLIKRCCAVCQVLESVLFFLFGLLFISFFKAPVDLEAEEEAVKDECETYDIPIDDVEFPLNFTWLHRHDAVGDPNKGNFNY